MTMTALVNVSYALIVGALAAQLWLRSTAENRAQRVYDSLASIMGIGFVVGAGATLMSLWQASAAMADVPLRESGPSLWAIFANTSYGRFGLTSFAVLAVGAAVHFTLGRRVPSGAYPGTILCILGMFAVCRVATGHAAESGLFSVAAVVELTHVFSMALWLGSVLIAAWVVLPKATSATGFTGIETYLALLSSWATVALAGVLSTGLYNVFRVLNTSAELIKTQYGWSLTTKLFFVVVAIALGGWNRLVGFPAAVAAAKSDASDKRVGAITSVLRVESISLLIVLIAAAALTANASPSSS